MGLLVAGCACAQTPKPMQVLVDWSAGGDQVKTVATLQVVVNPLLRRGSAIHDEAWKSLKELGADDVRYVPWHPYPRLCSMSISLNTSHHATL